MQQPRSTRPSWASRLSLPSHPILLFPARKGVSFGANAARDARRRFDLKRQVGAYLEWYQELAASTEDAGDRSEHDCDSTRKPTLTKSSI